MDGVGGKLSLFWENRKELECAITLDAYDMLQQETPDPGMLAQQAANACERKIENLFCRELTERHMRNHKERSCGFLIFLGLIFINNWADDNTFKQPIGLNTIFPVNGVNNLINSISAGSDI